MRYWKRVDSQGKTTTVESYSHNIPIEGAIEISEAEFNLFIASLPMSKFRVKQPGLWTRIRGALRP